MAKKNEFVLYTEESFKQAMQQAAELNRQKKEIDAKLKEFKPNLINYMETNHIDKMAEGPYSASYMEVSSSKLDEEAVIALLEKKVRQARSAEKKELYGSAIKTVKLVDEDVLESLLYDGYISSKDLEPLTSTTVSKRIRLDYKK